MKRTLAISALAALALGGCATYAGTDYGYGYTSGYSGYYPYPYSYYDSGPVVYPSVTVGGYYYDRTPDWHDRRHDGDHRWREDEHAQRPESHREAPRHDEGAGRAGHIQEGWVGPNGQSQPPSFQGGY